MFNSISGTVTEKLIDAVRISTGGIEWDISVPQSDVAVLPGEGAEARVFTWLSHREDQMKLFGFADEKRRATFLELLKVEGIGPKGAIKILGGIGQAELEAALDNEDLGTLTNIPGLGKKTAQKMILALKGKLTDIKTEPASPYGDLVDALAEMGYDKKAAAAALEKAAKEIPAGTAAAEKEKLLFKQAILNLSGT